MRTSEFSLPEGVRLYVVGDIHGCVEKLTALHDVMEADMEGFLGEIHIVYVGDYVDKGLHSAKVIEALRAKKWPRAMKVVFLRGNHDWALMQFLKNPKKYGFWYKMWGGEATLASYGVRFSHSTASEVVAARFSTVFPVGHKQFFENLQLFHTVGNYLCVHAGVRPKVVLEEQSEDDLMFIKDTIFKPTAPHGLPYRVVYGHKAGKTPVTLPDRVCVDTGAYRGGALTCGVFEGLGERFLEG